MASSIWDEIDQVLASPPATKGTSAASVWDEVDAVLAAPPAVHQPPLTSTRPKPFHVESTLVPGSARVTSPAPAVTMPPFAAPHGDEIAFRQWYAGVQAKRGSGRDPDVNAINPSVYDYRAAFRARAPIPGPEEHWDSQFKGPDHPNRIVGGFDTATLERVPGTARATEAELVAQGWSPDAAAELSRKPEPPTTRGLVTPGNVDLFAQPKVKNPDGTTSTVDSSSYNIDGVEVLLPSVTPDGRHLQTEDEIIAEYERTGRHLGKFSDPDSATAYASQLHDDYAAGKYDRQPTTAQGDFSSRLKALTERMAALGYPVRVTSAGRSAQEQARLYAQGRSRPGRVVTELDGQPGRESRHQLGQAADLAFIGPNGQPSFAESHPWEILGREAKALGLEWGGDFKTLRDRPHVQMPKGAETVAKTTPAPAGEKKPAAPRTATFGEAVGRGVDIAQQLGYAALEATGEAIGADSITRVGREGRQRNQAQIAAAPARASIFDISSPGELGQWLKETIGEQIPIMVPSLAGGVAGAALGSVVPGVGTTIGGLIGAFAPSLVMGVGETQTSIKERGEDESSPAAAFVGGTAVAALDTILPGKIGGKLVARFGRETAEEIAKRALLTPAAGITRRTIQGVGTGMATEGLTEALQAAISEVSAATGTGTPTNPALVRQMVEEGAAGALVGGLAGGASAIPGPPPGPSVDDETRERVGRNLVESEVARRSSAFDPALWDEIDRTLATPPPVSVGPQERAPLADTQDRADLPDPQNQTTPPPVAASDVWQGVDQVLSTPPPPPAAPASAPAVAPATPPAAVAPAEGAAPSGDLPPVAERNAQARAEAQAQPPAFVDPAAIESGRKLERRLQSGDSPTGQERRQTPFEYPKSTSVSPSTGLAETPSLAVRLDNGKDLRAVGSLEEAGHLVDEMRDTAEREGMGGASNFPRVTVIDTKTGEEVARISYNGRIWDAKDDKRELVERTDRRGFGKPDTIDVKPESSESPSRVPVSPAVAQLLRKAFPNMEPERWTREGRYLVEAPDPSMGKYAVGFRINLNASPITVESIGPKADKQISNEVRRRLTAFVAKHPELAREFAPSTSLADIEVEPTAPAAPRSAPPATVLLDWFTSKWGTKYDKAFYASAVKKMREQKTDDDRRAWVTTWTAKQDRAIERHAEIEEADKKRPEVTVQIRRELRRILAEMDNIPFTPKTYNEGGVGKGGDIEVRGRVAGASVFDDILQLAPGTSTPSRGSVVNAIHRFLEDGIVTNPVRGALEVARARAAGSTVVAGTRLSTPELPISAGNEPGQIYVQRFTGLKPEILEAQERFAAALEADSQGFIDRYIKRFGKFVGADHAKELFPEYAESKESRTKYDLAVHRAASALAQAVYERLLEQPVPAGQDAIVIFTAGGTGSGKTSSMEKALPDLIEASKIVYDSTLTSLDHAAINIERAIGSGHQIALIYTERDVREAFEATIKRARQMGRPVTLKTHLTTHKLSPQVYRQLIDRYGFDDPAVTFLVIHNKTGEQPTFEPATEAWEAPAYNEGDVRAHLEGIVDRESRAGKLSAALEEAIWPEASRPAQGRADHSRRPEAVSPAEGRPGDVAEPATPPEVIPTPAPPSDILDTGEEQPRLPAAGAARQVGQANTTLRAPTQATDDTFARSFLGENVEPEAKTGGLFDAPASTEPETPAPPSAPSTPTRNLNARHTLKIADVTTPAGALTADARNSRADSSVWFHQGDPGQLRFTANVKINGEADPRAGAAKETLEEIEKAKAAGWSLVNMRAGSYGTVWTLQKGKEILTRAGAQAIVGGSFAAPEVERSEPGYDGMVASQTAYAIRFAEWLATLPATTLESASALGTKLSTTGIGAWVRIEDDPGGKRLWFLKDDTRDVGLFASSQAELLHKVIHLARLGRDKADDEAFSRVFQADAKAKERADAKVSVHDALREDGFLKAEPEPAAAESPTDTREATIDRIVTASRKPEPKVVPVVMGKGTDGKWYRARGNTLPIGVSTTGETRIDGYVFEDAQGTTYGTIKPTAEELLEGWRKAQDRDAEEFRRLLRDKSDADLEKTAEHWLTDQRAMTLARHDDLMTRLREGEVEPRELRVALQQVLDNRANLLRELGSLKKDDLLKRMGGFKADRYKNDKKAEVVRAAWSDILVDFVLEQSFSYGIGQDSLENAVRAKVEKYTDADIAAYKKRVEEARAERSKRIAGYKKALTNPETLEEFDTFVKLHKEGEAGLTPEQRATYDELRAKAGRAKRVEADQRRDVVQAADEQVGAKLVETKHTRQGYDLFVVQLEKRVERDDYTRLLNAAKKLGGWYSSFNKAGAVPGFQFKDKAAGEAFLTLVTEGDTAAVQGAATERRSDRRAAKKNAAAERLAEMADKLEADAQERLNADRQVNTARRARMAASVEAQAQADIAMARTLRNLSDAIESGEATHLDGIRTKVQVETLNRFAEQARYERLRFQYPEYRDYEQHKDRPVEPADIDKAEYPKVTATKADLHSAATSLEEKGGKQVAIRLRALVNREWNGQERITVPRDILVAAVGRDEEGARRVLPWAWASRLGDMRRLETAGIPDLPTLRAALREFIQHRGEKPHTDKVKILERELAGDKGVGIDFFPTPEPLALRMAEALDLQKGMTVLEPSAGKGNLADAVRTVNSEVEIHVVEISPKLRAILEAKGYHLAGQDFTAFAGEQDRESRYDRVIMNPPFSVGQDADHVQRAYALLKPGGRLVAITGEGIFFRGDKKATAFREWFDEVGGQSEKLEGAFLDKREVKTTGVNSRLLIIDKPLSAASGRSAGGAVESLPIGKGPYAPLPPASGPARPITDRMRHARIIENYLKALEGLPLRLGHFTQRAHGIYKSDVRAIRLRVANDLQTFFHEAGHDLDIAILGLDRADLRWNSELLRLGQRTAKPSADQETIRKEGAAEFFRLYMTQPDVAEQRAPHYFAAFEAALHDRPELETSIHSVREDLAGLISQSPATRGRLRVDWDGQDRGIARTFAEDPKKGLQAMARALVDDLQPLKLAVEQMRDGRPLAMTGNAYVLARIARGASGKAEAFLERGVRGRNGQFIAGSLADALRPVAEAIQPFGEYLVALRAVELHGRNINPGLALDEAQAILDETAERPDFEAFKAASDAVYAYQDAILSYAQQQGVFSKRQLKQIRALNEAYVPMQRVFDDAESVFDGSGAAGRIANRANPVKRIFGSGRDIVNPFESMVKNTFAIVDMVEKNRAMQALVRQAETAAGSARWIERIPDPKIATKFNLSQVSNDIKKALHDAGLSDFVPDNLDEALDAMVTVFTPASFAKGSEQIVTVIRNGEREFWQVNTPELYDAITNIGARDTSRLVRFLEAPARLLRAGATLTPGFVLRNPFRDTFVAFLQSRYGFIPVVDTLRGLVEQLRGGEAAQLFFNSGVAQAALTAQDRRHRQLAVERLKSSRWQRMTLHPIDVMRALSAQLEVATRLGEFKLALEAGGLEQGVLGRLFSQKTGGRLDEETLVNAAFAARDVTTDFARGGSVAKAINRYDAFFNARVQGYVRMVEAVQRDPVGVLAKLGSLALFSAALYALNYDDDEYQQLEQWEKHTYWHVKLPGVNWYFRIPKPFEWGYAADITEATLEYLHSTEPQRFNQILSEFVGTNPTQTIVNLMPSTILPIVEAVANYDAFRDTHIVRPWDLDLDTDLQFTEWTSETAKLLGKVMPVSPAILDHVIYGYTAGFGRGVVGVVDKGLQVVGAAPGKAPAARPVQQYPVVGNFLREKAYSGSAQDIQDLYDLAEAIVKVEQSIKADKDLESKRSRLADAQADLPWRRRGAILSARQALKNLSAEIKAVYAAPPSRLTPAQKRERLDAIYRRMRITAGVALGRPTPREGVAR